jgi:hypothetical protein
MATKKPRPHQMKIQVAEIRGEAGPGQPQMIWHLPFLVTSGGASAALKGVELAAKGVQTAIDAKTAAPLQFEIRGSWLDSKGYHRVDFRIRNSIKNSIFVESLQIKREYLDPYGIDPNRTTHPVIWPGCNGRPSAYVGTSPLELPLLILGEDLGTLQISFPMVDKKKLKSECAVATVGFADLGKEKSDKTHFDIRLRWHDLL